MTIGVTPFVPVRGVWSAWNPLHEHESFRLIHPAWAGVRLFQRAVWQWPRVGVIAQFREARETHAMHLYVHEDGTWTIDHTDDVNPDWSLVHAVGHFLKDVP